MIDRKGAQQTSEDDITNQQSWPTFDKDGGSRGVPMQTNPMASARESDLSRRAREIYAATSLTRESRTASTIEKQQKAEL